MKLQTQTNIYTISYILLILIVTGFFLQITLQRIYYKQIDDGIKTEREIIQEEIEHLGTVPDYSGVFGHQIEVSLLQKPVPITNIFKDLLLYNPSTKSNILFRHHYFSKNRRNGMGYTISILKPLTELHKFKKVVMISISLAFAFLLMAFLGTGYFVNRRLWKPFFNTLEDLNRFNIDAPASLSFAETHIQEFKQLNQIISKLSHRLKRDFVRLKEFSENLSHEINTMLSIIISKVELLLQNEDLTDEQIEHIRTIYQVTNNLTHLNNGLLLLAKIDNHYYTNLEEINLENTIQEHLQTFDDFIKQKNITISLSLSSTSIRMNKSLANVLISNMIINSIKHNIQHGFIKIVLTENLINIENSCVQTKVSSQEVNEFTNNKPYKSLGMGLEIIKRICRTYNLSIINSDENGIYKSIVGINLKKISGKNP